MIENKSIDSTPEKLAEDFRNCLRNRASCHSEFYRRLSTATTSQATYKQNTTNTHCKAHSVVVVPSTSILCDWCGQKIVRHVTDVIADKNETKLSFPTPSMELNQDSTNDRGSNTYKQITNDDPQLFTQNDGKTDVSKVVSSIEITNSIAYGKTSDEFPINSKKNKCRSEDETNVSYSSTVETLTSPESEPLPQKNKNISNFDIKTTVNVSNQPDGAVSSSLIEERKAKLYSKFVIVNENTAALLKDYKDFPCVENLVKMYTKLLQEKKQSPAVENEKINRSSPLSDEGCTVNQSPYSSDGEENETEHGKKKEKVARSSSSDSALGLDDESAEPPSTHSNQARRMTLTVTDLPLRPALLPLAEPVHLPESPTSEQQQLSTALTTLLTQTAIPSKVLIEERVVEIPDDRFTSLSSSRRESAQSCTSDYNSSEYGAVRYVRTPSVVVSDYSDDVMCGITLEEIEYFRAQRMRRRSSAETAGTEKDDAISEHSGTSSCSNLYYCGSTISALDGAECYVNGVRMTIDRKISDCSTCSTVSGDDEDDDGFSFNDFAAEINDYNKQQLPEHQREHSCRKQNKLGSSKMTPV